MSLVSPAEQLLYLLCNCKEGAREREYLHQVNFTGYVGHAPFRKIRGHDRSRRTVPGNMHAKFGVCIALGMHCRLQLAGSD